MNRLYISLTALLISVAAHPIEFEGVGNTPVRVKPDVSSGLSEVCVLPPLSSPVTMIYTSSTDNVHWYRFSNLGGAYAEEIACTHSGKEWRASFSGEDMGYIIEDGSTRYCFWIVNYGNHRLVLRSLEPAPEQECDRTILSFDGEAEEIPFFSINGRKLSLARELELEYNNTLYNEESFDYTNTPISTLLDGATSIISIPAVFTSTSFRLRGDRFLKVWGLEESISSETFTPIAVTAETRATQSSRENDNEQHEDASLGGSAPCDITFEAIASDAAIFTEWQISRFPDFDIVDNSFSQLSFDYTFDDSGTTYVRFVANNADGTCEYLSNTYEVFIGESKLEIPNAFSPESSPGVNDEWKVSYKSLVSFECHVFNSWGTKLFSTTNPAEGWDGKYNGKYVPAGVYYYVIKAEGADGIIYERAGDINIVGLKTSTTPQP